MTSFHKDEVGGKKKACNWALSPAAILLGLSRLLLLIGIAAAGVGYVGCFGLVQASNTSLKGPGIWLALEVTLCIIRLIVWALNPDFDDPPPPIAIRKSYDQTEMTYDIGWVLGDDVLRVDDLHAVVIGLDKPDGPKPEDRLTSAAQSVVMYLQELAVPKRQIKSFYNNSASSEDITETLRALATDNSIRPGAPIVLYFACFLTEDLRDNTAPRPDEPEPTRLVLHTYDYASNKPGTGLSYTKLLDLLQTISINKGNNITVIFDTSPPMADENMFLRVTRELRIGFPSHVLLAMYGGVTGVKGVFTRSLLKQLGITDADLTSASPWKLIRRALLQCLHRSIHDAPTAAKDIRRITYRDLIDNIQEELEAFWRRYEILPPPPICSGDFQNRLLFNGLLASKRLRRTSTNTSVILISSDGAEKGKEEV